jgi:hypothetical protein
MGMGNDRLEDEKGERMRRRCGGGRRPVEDVIGRRRLTPHADESHEPIKRIPPVLILLDP